MNRFDYIRPGDVFDMVPVRRPFLGGLFGFMILTSLAGWAAASEDRIRSGIENPSPGLSMEARPEQQAVEINFENADILTFIKFVSEVTGKPFVVDADVTGKVTAVFPQKVSARDLYAIFQSILEVHGFTTVEAGRIIKIVPASDARSKGVPTKSVP
jgi:type II secretory pathway component GspD/PulD (secretin)